MKCETGKEIGIEDRAMPHVCPKMFVDATTRSILEHHSYRASVLPIGEYWIIILQQTKQHSRQTHRKIYV